MTTKIKDHCQDCQHFNDLSGCQRGTSPGMPVCLKYSEGIKLNKDEKENKHNDRI